MKSFRQNRAKAIVKYEHIFTKISNFNVHLTKVLHVTAVLCSQTTY